MPTRRRSFPPKKLVNPAPPVNVLGGAGAGADAAKGDAAGGEDAAPPLEVPPATAAELPAGAIPEPRPAAGMEEAGVAVLANTARLGVLAPARPVGAGSTSVMGAGWLGRLGGGGGRTGRPDGETMEGEGDSPSLDSSAAARASSSARRSLPLCSA